MSPANSTYSILIANVLASGLVDVDRRLSEILRAEIEKINELELWFLS